MTRHKFWQINNKTQDEGEILLYGDIGNFDGWCDVTAKQFDKDLKGLGDVSTINVRINSVGGDVFAGQAIHSMLRNHKATVNVYVDGLAASIASVVAMAGDTVTMPKNAMMMIHNPWTFAAGNAKDFRKTADDLDKIAESIVSAYEGKCKQTRDEIKVIMDEETWLTAEEAVELGFADVIDEGKQVAASLSKGVYAINGQTFDLSKFNHADKVYKSTVIVENKKEEPRKMEITASMLKEQYADVYNAIKQEGVESERNRLKGLDGIVTAGCEEVINKAKYETFASVEQTAIEVLNHIKANPQPQAPKNPVAALVADAEVLNTVGTPSPEDQEAQAKAEAEKQRQNILSAMLQGANGVGRKQGGM